MSNWFKRFLGLIGDSKDDNTQNLHKGKSNPNPNDTLYIKKNNDAKVVYDYPKGNFRFPVIPDERNAEVASNLKRSERSNTSRIRPPRQAPTRQGESQRQPRRSEQLESVRDRPAKREKVEPLVTRKEHRTTSRSRTEVTEPKIENKHPFKPTEVPSPVFGFKKNEKGTANQQSISNDESTTTQIGPRVTRRRDEQNPTSLESPAVERVGGTEEVEQAINKLYYEKVASVDEKLELNMVEKFDVRINSEDDDKDVQVEDSFSEYESNEQKLSSFTTYEYTATEEVQAEELLNQASHMEQEQKTISKDDQEILIETESAPIEEDKDEIQPLDSHEIDVEHEELPAIEPVATNENPIGLVETEPLLAITDHEEQHKESEQTATVNGKEASQVPDMITNTEVFDDQELIAEPTADKPMGQEVLSEANHPFMSISSIQAMQTDKLEREELDEPEELEKTEESDGIKELAGHSVEVVDSALKPSKQANLILNETNYNEVAVTTEDTVELQSPTESDKGQNHREFSDVLGREKGEWSVVSNDKDEAELKAKKAAEFAAFAAGDSLNQDSSEHIIESNYTVEEQRTVEHSQDHTNSDHEPIRTASTLEQNKSVSREEYAHNITHTEVPTPSKQKSEKLTWNGEVVPFNVLMLRQDKKKVEKPNSERRQEPMKPAMSLLDVPPSEVDNDQEWIQEQTELLDTAFESFNVRAKVVKATKGPAVTQFEVHPEHGVRVNKITNLSDDLKLALAAKDIRIEAPIPGKNTIGIEVPNRKSRPVLLREILRSPVFQQSTSPLVVALGLDISGQPVVTDLKKMPHGLIAGATGSGKSVCINSIIVSLLYKASPHEVKLLLIDPKMVELAPYNDIPHLVSPVITDVKAATAALKWAVEEMERRYELFAHEGVRDISRFNEKVLKENEKAETMPYLVIIIDELADLMMVSPADVEDAICRIAQKARACGIHLVLATQRPSVDVITGLIKANVPTRIAFSVSSQVDSRTIIDISGAEKLLGKGDMLLLENGSNKPVRVQGNFVSDDEIERVTEYVRKQSAPNYLFVQEELMKQSTEITEEDELFFEACEYIIEQEGASASSIQRRFRVGYNRAARLIDMMEAQGIVSEAKGSKPRDVLITKEQLSSLKGK